MAHYYHENPNTKSQRADIEYYFDGKLFRFVTDTDVFSRKGVDFGSDLLLKTVSAELQKRNISGGRLLDLGCGYGVVGVVMQSFFPEMKVVLADINKRALSLSSENAEKNHAKEVEIISSDGWSGLEQSFDFVLTNPPVRAGKDVVFSFYEGAFSHLNEGGTLYVVLQKKQGAPSSIAFLEKLFGNCEVLEKDAGYWIFAARR